MSEKEASSQAAWALITEGVTSARVEAHRLRHMVNRGVALVERSNHKEHLYQVAGDLIVAVPGRLDRLENDLDRTALALAHMGEDFLEARLPLSDRAMVDEAVKAVSFVSPRMKGAVESLARRYLARIKQTPNQMSGYSTYTTERSQKGLPQVTNRPSSDPDAYPYSSLPQPSDNPGKDRTLKVPQPHYQTPSPVQDHGSDEPASSDRGAFMQVDPEAPVNERPRTVGKPGEERGFEWIEQGTRLHQRRPEVLASDEAEMEDDDEKLAKKQKNVRGPDKAKSRSYERQRRQDPGRKTDLKTYRRKYKDEISNYNKYYYEHPGARKRIAMARRVARQFVATFYRKEEGPPDGRAVGYQEVRVPSSETPPTPFGGIPRDPPRSDGSAKVVPPNSGHVQNWKYGALLSAIEGGLDPSLAGRSRELSVDLKRVDPKNAMWTFAVQGSKSPYKVRVKVDRQGRIRDIEKADIKISCSCPFWQWQGPEHWAKQGDYLYGRPVGTASTPVVKDPNGGHRICKHVAATFRHMRDKGFRVLDPR